MWYGIIIYKVVFDGEVVFIVDICFLMFGVICLLSLLVVYVECGLFLVEVNWIEFFVIDNFGILFIMLLNYKLFDRFS